MKPASAARVLAAVAGLSFSLPVPACAATAAGSIITNLVSVYWWNELSQTVTGAPMSDTQSAAYATVGGFASAVSGTSDRVSAAPGDIVTRTITYSIPASVSAATLVLFDTLPPYVHYVAGSASIAPDPGWDPDPGPPGHVRWTIAGPFPSGVSGEITYQYSVDWGAGEIFEPGSGDVAAPEAYPLLARPLLSWAGGTPGGLLGATSTVFVDWFEFIKTGPPGGSEVAYTIMVRNKSAAKTWFGVTVWDTVPAALDVWAPGYGFGDPCNTWSMTPTGCPAGSPSWTTAGGRTLLRWNLGALGPGQSVYLVWQARLDPAVTSATTVDNIAAVAAAGQPGPGGTGASGANCFAVASLPLVPGYTPPGAPPGLTARHLGGSIGLSWSTAAAGSSPITAYLIYQATCATCAGYAYDMVWAPKAKYVDVYIVPYDPYWYEITALDETWVESPPSPRAMAAYGPCTDPSWYPRAPMLSVEADNPAVASIGGRLVLAGGLDVEVFDPAMETWTAGAPPLNEEYEVASAALNGTLFVAGGYGPASGWTPVNTVNAYGAGTDSWSTLASMPTARWCATGAAANGKFYVIGGFDSSSTGLSTVEEYDPATNSWATRSPMPTARGLSAAATAGGKIYVIGGYPDYGVNDAYDTVEVYDPVLDSWATAPAMRVPKAGLSAAVVGGSIYVIGGDYSWVPTSSVDVFDTATNSWTPACHLNTPRTWAGAAAIGGTVYVMGGFDGGWAPLNTVEATSPSGPPPTPPSAPGTLTALGGPGLVQLEWSPAVPGTYPVAGYDLYRSTCSACGFTILGVIGAGATSFSDYGVPSCDTAWYKIQALDTLANVGPFSVTISGAPTCAPVTGLAVTAVKTMNPAAPGLGTPVTFQIVVTNSGAQTITDLTVVDTVSPLIVNQVAGTPAGWAAPAVTSVASGTRYMWSSAGLTFLPGTSTTFTISGNIGVFLWPPAVSNTAFVTASGPAGATSISTNVVGSVIQPPVASLSVVKLQTPAAPVTGGPVSYRIVMTNTGSATLDNVSIMDTLQAVITAVTTDQPAGMGLPVVADAGSGTRYVWTSAGLTFLPGQSLTVTITGTVGTVAVPTAVSNTAYVTGWCSWMIGLGSAAAYSPVIGFVVAPVTMCAPALDLWESTPVPQNAKAGDVVEYRISFSNTTDCTGWSVVITTQGGSFSNRVKTVTPPGSLWVSGGFGAVLPQWANSLNGPWNATSDNGQTEPLYLRWILGRVGLHKSGFIRYQAQVLPGSCQLLPAYASATLTSGFPDFIPYIVPYTASATGNQLCDPPAAPLTLSAVGGVGQIVLGWTPAAPGANPLTAYEIFRSTCGGCAYVSVATVGSWLAQWADTTVPVGVVSTYEVLARDAVGITGILSVPSGNATRLPPPDAVLTASAAAPMTEYVGNTFNVVVTIHNTGTGAANAVTPSLGVAAGAPFVSLMSGPIPTGPFAIPAGGSSSFTWVYRADGAGPVSFAASGAGTALNTGLPLGSASSTANVALSLTPTGTVVIIGGPTGPIDPTLGQQVAITVWPSGAGTITVRIYDMGGTLVRTMMASTGGGGVTFYWNGRDNGGAIVPPGGYPIQILGPGVNKTDMLGVLY